MGKVAEFRHEGTVFDWANESGSQINAGDIVPLGSCCGVAITDIPDGGTGSVRVSGVYDVEGTNNFSLVQGAVVYYDAATKKATDNTSKHFLGIAALKKATADKIVRVKIGYEWHTPYSGEEVIRHKNTSGSKINEGDVVGFTDFVGIAAEDIANAETGDIYITGVYELAAEHDSTGKDFTAGDFLYFASDALTKTAASGVPVGICVEDKTSAGEKAKVRLGPGIPRAAV